MASIIVQGYRVKVSGWDAFIAFWLPLWNSYTGEVRRIPRNLNSFYMSFRLILKGVIFCSITLPIFWYLSQWPFIWPEATAMMVGFVVISVGTDHYKDCSRSIISLIIFTTMLLKKVTFGVTAFGYHLEKYFYYIIIAAALITIWRYLLNQLCWSQIDRMCKKYGFPEYDQEVLEARYTGIPIREEQIVHETFSDAVASHKQLESA